MTMLDRMRRHRNWLKWSLALVCLAFVIFYIPDLVGVGPTVVTADNVAVINGQPIRADEFRRMYQAQLQAYRSSYGGNMSDQLLKQLGIDQQILAQMVDERAAIAEAERLGLTVSDEEVAQRIFTIPAFQENGAFIGSQRYQQVLAAQRPPLTTTDFEDSIRRSLLADKLRASVTEWISVSEKELEAEYRRRNDKVKLAVVPFNVDSYRLDVSATDADVASYFEAHKNDFKVPEKRKVKYILIDVDALRAKLQISQQDIERAYNENIQRYTTPEQVRASHILLKTDGKNDEAVKAKAEDVLKQAKAGADFAKLAQTYSEDDANKSKGGDLDFFGKGRMVPEFDAAAFSMTPGQISDLVKTEYGYHIIKLTDKKPGTTRPLSEVREQIVEELGYQRAQAQAVDLAQKIEPQIRKPADLDTVAKAEGLTVQETGFFASNEPIMGIGPSQEMTSRAFSMNQGEVAGPLRTGRGFVFETLVAKQDPYVPMLEEAKDKVRDELIRQRARDMAKQKAAELAAKLKSADFDKTLKAEKIDPKTTDLIARDGSIPDLGSSAEILDAAFKLPIGAVSDPITTDNGAAVVKVLDKKETTEADLASAKDTFRNELLTDRRNRFYSAYMVKAKQRMKIQLNREAIQRVVG